MSRFKLLYFVIFIINLCRLNAQISDKRLCVDEECKVPISLAKTLLRYSSPDSRILSFAPNVDITIYSKSAGSRADLWGGEINGKRGYIPKHLVRETKILQKPTLLVDTEFSNDTETKQVPSQVKPDKVQEPYEVVDGTTIYTNPQDEIEPTSTDSPIQATALPVTEAQPTKIGVPEVAPRQQPPTKDAEKVDSKAETASQEGEMLQVAVTGQTSAEKEDSKTETPSKEKEIGLKETVINQTSTEAEISQKEEIPPGQTSAEEKDSKTETPPKKEEIRPKETVIDQTSTEAEISQKEETLPGQISVETNEEIDLEIEDDDDGEDEDDTEENEDDDDDDEEDEGELIENANIASPEKKADITFEQKTEAAVESSPPQTGQNIEENAEIKPEEILHFLHPSEEIKSEVNDVIKEAIAAANPEDSEIKETLQVEVTADQTVKVPDSADVNPEVAPTEQKEVAGEELKDNKEAPQMNEEKEEVFAPKIEVTTVSPELEVPQPFDEGLEEVTPNPMEATSDEVKVIENVIPTLPPLGLFSQNLNSVSSEEVVNENTEASEEQNKGIDEDTIQGTTEPTTEDFSNENVEVANDSSIQDDSIEMLEKNWSSDENKEVPESIENKVEEKEDPGFLSGFMSMFDTNPTESGLIEEAVEKELTSEHVAVGGEENRQKPTEAEEFIPEDDAERFCDAESCQKPQQNMDSDPVDLFFTFNSDVFLYLVTTAVSVIIFLFGYIAFDKNKREGPLVAKINNLEKELLIILKENQLLQDKICGDSGYETNDRVPNEVVENLKQDLDELTNIRYSLEEQVQSLEKELENSTEVGMELNRMLSEILSSEGGSDVLKANVEHLQRQLVEQQATINSINETLAITNTENHELKLELELSNKKVVDLQAELDKLLLNVLKIEEEKEAQQSSLENEIAKYKQKFEETYSKLRTKEDEYSVEVKQLKNRLIQTERNLELKIGEFDVLTETVKQLKAMKTNDGPTLKSLLDTNSIKAELQLLKAENQKFSEKLQQEEEAKLNYQKTAQSAVEEVQRLKEKYDEADKLKVETETKLEVLSNYFKDREAQLQKEIAKHESLWMEKQGEATSTTERIRFMQEQLQNYKAQTESLKQEIVSQEVELKSQISVLEKKAHENWVSARQAERKLEEAKQEAAQLRHRLTLRERAIQEDKNPHRYQSPIEQNGDMPVSPLESPASPPLLYGTRDHITKSPPIPGLPPFLPPPPGVPFMPPPLHGVPPFIPPPPTMFPGDHRPPPLGRMSSPPLNSRYSPSSRGYSPYDSSPSDSEYGTSPPQRRGYSPFNSRGEDRRDYKRPPPGRTNGRNIMKDGGSSGSGHSNESLEKINRQQSKV